MTARAEIVAALDGVDALGERNYADWRPDGEDLPYATVTMGETGRALEGDARTEAWRHGAQVDLWERWEDEDGTLAEAAKNALDGLALDDGLRLRVSATSRTWEEGRPRVRTMLLLTFVRLR